MRYGKNIFPALANTPLCVFMCLLLVGKKPTWRDSSASLSLLHSALLETGKLLFTYYKASRIHLQQRTLGKSTLQTEFFQINSYLLTCTCFPY